MNEKKHICKKLLNYYFEQFSLHEHHKKHEYICQTDNTGSYFITDLKIDEYMKILLRSPNSLKIEKISKLNDNTRYSITYTEGYPLWVYTPKSEPDENPTNYLTNKIIVAINETKKNWHAWPCQSDNMIPFKDIDYNFVDFIRKIYLDPSSHEIDYINNAFNCLYYESKLLKNMNKILIYPHQK